MPNQTRNLFISYRSSDAPKVDKIARDLALLRFDDGTPRFTTWQDKHNLPPASPNWWDAIVDAIIACEVFVFNLSRASLQSEVCRAELDYAHKRNRPIVPLVLEGEFFLNPQSGKYDLPKETWALVPDWLGQAQFLFYTGAAFYQQFQTAIELFERNWLRDINAPRPLNPDSKSVHGSNHGVYAAARDYAYRLAFADAEKHFDTLVRRNDMLYANASAHWLERIRLYSELMEMVEQNSPMFGFKKRWAVYEALPTDYLEGEIFDPKGFAARVIAPAPPPVSKPAKPCSTNLLPAPFAWVDIPAGQVTLTAGGYVPEDGQTFYVTAFKIAKYPLTNVQYKLFVDAGGYGEKRWWTVAGWTQREQDNWTEPRYWRDARWNGAEQPVVGVSWYEAMAFCLWLSEQASEKIMLPTEQQWQRAAQGDNGWSYPWGNKWDKTRCNNSVKLLGSDVTTPVQQFEGKGDSPFGVVDMVGNVGEWCLTDYEHGIYDINSSVIHPILRGGSWDISNSNHFRCDFRSWSFPHRWGDGVGLRLALSE